MNSRGPMSNAVLKAYSSCRRLTPISSHNLSIGIGSLICARIHSATVNTVATYAPYVSTAYSLASLAFNNGVGYFAGSATAQGYATDATTGALLWEAVDKRGGTTAVVANTLNNWRDVDHAFEE